MEASSSKLRLRLPYRLSLILRGPHAGQQADRQQDELLLQLTDAVIIGESRYRVTVGSSRCSRAPGRSSSCRSGLCDRAEPLSRGCMSLLGLNANKAFSGTTTA